MVWIEILLLRPIFQLAEQYISGTTLIYSLLVLASFFASLLKGRLRLDVVSILFLGYIAVSSLISFLYGAAPSVLVATFNKLLLFFALMQILRLEHISFEHSFLLRFLSIAAYVQAVFVIVSLVLPSSYEATWGVRTFVMRFSSQHLTAAYIASLLGSILFEMKYVKAFRPSVAFVVCTGLLYALLMTGARTITACGAALYLIALYSYIVQLDRRGRLIVGAVLVGSIAGIVLLNADQFVFFQKNQSINGSISNGRDEIWAFYLNVLTQSNLLELMFGHGCGFYSSGQAFFVGAHNDFITFAVSYGLTGLALFAVYLFSSFCSLESRAIRLVLIGLVAFSAFSNGFCDYTDLVLAIVLTGIVFKRNNEVSKPGLNRLSVASKRLAG